MKYKYILIFSLALFFAFPVFASTPRAIIREEIKERVASRVAEVKKFIGVRMSLGQSLITAVNDKTITVNSDGVVYAINTGTLTKCTTQFRRKFWGKSSLSEMSVGDTLKIYGYWA